MICATGGGIQTVKVLIRCSETPKKLELQNLLSLFQITLYLVKKVLLAQFANQVQRKSERGKMRIMEVWNKDLHLPIQLQTPRKPPCLAGIIMDNGHSQCLFSKINILTSTCLTKAPTYLMLLQNKCFRDVTLIKKYKRKTCQ